jgi:hypothetical protein
MQRVQIPSTVALVIGIAMAIASTRLSLHQNDVAKQTTGEFIAYVTLSVGGVLIALIAAFGLGWSSRKLG